MEGLLVSLAFLILPFVVLFALVKILPPWGEDDGHGRATASNER
jgi:hypothetical protein